MKTLNLIQGSPEWIEARARYNTASEASVMMGQHPGCTRSELLRIKATGDEQEFSRFTLEVVFPRGHEVEDLARPLAEEIVGEELYPVTGVCEETGLLASFDGLTMDETVAWECKQWNEEKAETVRQGNIPVSDFWQVVQQFVVSRADKLVYMVTDGTPEKCVYLEAYPFQGSERELLDHWRQFDADKANYTPQEVQPQAVGRAPEDLPALRVEVQGMVTASNLDAFKDHALAVFEGINRELSTDTDFANAEKTVKWCKEVEDKLEGAKAQALEQTADLDHLFRSIDAIKQEARTVRLELDKLVKARKESIRAEIINEAQEDFVAHLTDLSEVLDLDLALVVSKPDFAGAMKGKRNISSLQDAAQTTLAAAKVEASRLYEHMKTSKQILEAETAGYGSLFPDGLELAQKAHDDLLAVIKTRIAEFQEQERQRADARAAEEIRQAATEAPQQLEPPATEQAPTEKPATTRPASSRARPTDAEIEQVIAAYFEVDIEVARGWLLDMAGRVAA